MATISRKHRLAFRIHDPAVNLDWTFWAIILTPPTASHTGIQLWQVLRFVYPSSVRIEAVTVRPFLVWTRITDGSWVQTHMNIHWSAEHLCRLRPLLRFTLVFKSSIRIKTVAIGSFLLRARIIILNTDELHRLRSNLHRSRVIFRGMPAVQIQAIRSGIP